MKRVVGLDIIRVIAILFVISVHYFRNTTFYTIPTTGKTMWILLAFRWLFYTCVPLFIILTGYLNRNKEPNKKYYTGIKKVLTSYFLISIICILARIFYFKEERRVLYWLVSLFNFTANEYSWYIEMYIGLFLLAPFFNVLYKGLEKKEQKQFLIGILIILTGLPSVLNNYNILGLNKIEIFPNWWEGIYPITYYFIGSYIGEYQPKFNKKYNVFGIFLVLLIQTSCFYLLVDGEHFSYSYFNGYGNALTAILSILLFTTFHDVDIKNKRLSKLVTSISLCSLDMYLFSYLIDLKISNILKEYLNTPKELLLHMIPTILSIFVICYLISLMKKIIFKILDKSEKIKKIEKT